MPPRTAPAIDPYAVIAVAWIGVAIGLTAVFGPQLGARGWMWLALHHLLCLIGVSHELRRYRQRQRQRQRQRLPITPSSASALPPEAPTPSPVAAAEEEKEEEEKP